MSGGGGAGGGQRERGRESLKETLCWAQSLTMQDSTLRSPPEPEPKPRV